MKISQKGINLIKQYEGCRLTAYQDIVNVWTIGYGHTKGVYRGQTITQKQADDWLSAEIVNHMRIAERLITVSLNQNQYDALASFHYNLGANILSNSTLLYYINSKQWQSAANEMKAYNKAGGQVVQGLVNRRNAETKLFLEQSASVNSNSKYYTSNPKRVKLLKATYLRKINAVNSADWDKQSNVIKPLFKKNEEFTITGIKKSSGGTPRLVTQSGYLLTANKEYVQQITGSTAVYYTIKQGDTVSVIADKYNVSINQIKTLNNLDNNFRIYAGNKLRVK